MATNRVYAQGRQLALVCSHPATPASGDPVRIGQLTGVALLDEGDGGAGTTETVVDLGPAVYDLSVEAIDGDGNSAVAVGDAIYYTDGDDPVLNKKSTGRLFGVALEAVGAGQTDTINVLLSGPQSAVGVGSLKVNLIDGQDETSDATYTLTGAAAGDEVVQVIHISTKAAIATMAEAAGFSITGADELTSGTTVDRTSDQLMVVWLDLT